MSCMTNVKYELQTEALEHFWRWSEIRKTQAKHFVHFNYFLPLDTKWVAKNIITASNDAASSNCLIL